MRWRWETGWEMLSAGSVVERGRSAMATPRVEKAVRQSPARSNVANSQSSVASLTRSESRAADAEVLAEPKLNVPEGLNRLQELLAVT